MEIRMRYLFVILNLWIFTAALSAVAQPPSLNCFNELTPVEYIICRDIELSRLDKNMERAYAKLRHLPEVRAEQLSWLDKRTQNCGLPNKKNASISLIEKWHALPCLVSLYEARLKVLGQASPRRQAGKPSSTRFIHPLCFDDLTRGEQIWHPLRLCNEAYRHIALEQNKAPYLEVGTKRTALITLIDQRDKGDVYRLDNDHGETSKFNSLWHLEFKTEREEIFVKINNIHKGGDRANGGLAWVELESEELMRVENFFTPAELVSEYAEVTNRFSRRNPLPLCSFCVGGVLTWHYNLKTGKMTFVAAKVKELKFYEYESATADAVECYSRILRQYGPRMRDRTNPGSFWLDLPSLKNFTTLVFDKCLHPQ